MTCLMPLQFKRTTPGSVTTALYPLGLEYKPILDPEHISAQIPAKFRRTAFPFYLTTAFELRALPHALLFKPDFQWPNPPFDYKLGRKWQNRLNMSISMEVPAKIHPMAVRRSKARFKMKAAISYIVTRGAFVGPGQKGEPAVLFDEDDAGEHWLLDGQHDPSLSPTSA